ncbi:MAG: HAMP domain-containing protein [Gammaproteobacteria bacterium]|nr:HAMP domain-containing protein [Gammaproteobacteria bacterium]NIR85363.1 HAMP domain-containing protein [Gammaproteobacteria bacterium]NIR88881.1 HAMP domain-containing protein [Gammaproteobacteria bacterium]NIU06489.1 HAMP domain-containing protein [Gammaproteobacteria bacterium]NIV53382.1 HAMP domain-containing protein [Gammaproteobacteria bacterium]
MFRSLARLVTSSLRYKLLFLVFLPVLLVAPATIGFVIYWSGNFSYDQLLMRVNSDLTVAHDAFVRTQRDYLQELETLANSYTFQTALETGDGETLQNQLKTLKKTTGFDFLHLTDLKGRWLFEDPTFVSGSSRPSPLIQKASDWSTPSVGVEVFPPEALLRESQELVQRSRVELVATPHTAPTERTVEDRALVVRATYPVRGLRGNTVALLDGGVLLNRNFGFVDAIRDLVYGPGSLLEGSIGTVTVLLDDVRVSTNVPRRAGERALGTRVSEQVRDRVLQHGNTWVDRAFVVNDWYISGYEPIIDVYGKRVGMLYTGFLETPFRRAYYQALAVLVGLLLLGTGIAVLVAARGARSIFRPIEAMAAVVHATRAGEDRRIGRLVSRDEIGQLARQFDDMLNLLQHRNEQIREAAEKLESKVNERTRELTEKNARLQETIDLLRETERQLIVAEKLAALGQLTAGVAHEINNPVAVIQGNLEILRNELGENVEPVRTEVELIFEQVDRIRAIVEKLLVYSRSSVVRSHLEEVRVRDVIEDTLVLVRHQLDSKGVSVQRAYSETGTVVIDRQELQQVLVNLLLNAVHALGKDGTIELSTGDQGDTGVSIRVHDNGVGIPSDHLARVFDPFFTARRGGTGLGLSISYSLIRRYGGNISVGSVLGQGSTFEVCLLRTPELSDEEALLTSRHVDATA